MLLVSTFLKIWSFKNPAFCWICSRYGEVALYNYIFNHQWCQTVCANSAKFPEWMLQFLIQLVSWQTLLLLQMLTICCVVSPPGAPYFLFKVIGFQFSKLIVRSLFFIYFLYGNCIKLAVTEASILFHLWSNCPNAHSCFVWLHQFWTIGHTHTQKMPFTYPTHEYAVNMNHTSSVALTWPVKNYLICSIATLFCIAISPLLLVDVTL